MQEIYIIEVENGTAIIRSATGKLLLPIKILNEIRALNKKAGFTTLTEESAKVFTKTC